MNSLPRVFDVNSFRDGRGGLCVLEGEGLPFTVERIYYLFDVPLGAIRGEHGHKKLEQLVICMNGACDITLNDGRQSYHFLLDDPAKALYIPPGMWRQLAFQKPSTVCCVLASTRYDRDDYLFTYEDFQKWVQDESDAAR